MKEMLICVAIAIQLLSCNQVVKTVSVQETEPVCYERFNIFDMNYAESPEGSEVCVELSLDSQKHIILVKYNHNEMFFSKGDDNIKNIFSFSPNMPIGQHEFRLNYKGYLMKDSLILIKRYFVEDLEKDQDFFVSAVGFYGLSNSSEFLLSGKCRNLQDEDILLHPDSLYSKSLKIIENKYHLSNDTFIVFEKVHKNGRFSTGKLEVPLSRYGLSSRNGSSMRELFFWLFIPHSDIRNL